MTPYKINRHHALGPLVRAARGLAKDIGTPVWVLMDRITLIVPDRSLSYVCVGNDEIIVNIDAWKSYTPEQWDLEIHLGGKS